MMSFSRTSHDMPTPPSNAEVKKVRNLRCEKKKKNLWTRIKMVQSLSSGARYEGEHGSKDILLSILRQLDRYQRIAFLVSHSL